MRAPRGPALFPAELFALPLTAGCSNSAEEEAWSIAEGFLADWSAGRLTEAAALTTDADAATALFEQTAEDLPDAVLSAEVDGRQDAVTVDDVRGMNPEAIVVSPGPAAMGGSTRAESRPRTRSGGVHGARLSDRGFSMP
mgnify:CR=1 FL=1